MLSFSGTEQITLELGGTVDSRQAHTLVGPDLVPLLEQGRAEVGLLLFRMRGLRPRSMPIPGFDYGEALWRVGVEHQGAPAWFAVACDLDQPLVRLLGGWLVRYPVRRGEVTCAEEEDRVTFRVCDPQGRALEVHAHPAESAPQPVTPRPLLARGRGSLFQIPWREALSLWCRDAACAISTSQLVETTLGIVRWHRRGLLHRGRSHLCGVARRVG